MQAVIDFINLIFYLHFVVSKLTLFYFHYSKWNELNLKEGTKWRKKPLLDCCLIGSLWLIASRHITFNAKIKPLKPRDSGVDFQPNHLLTAYWSAGYLQEISCIVSITFLMKKKLRTKILIRFHSNEFEQNEIYSYKKGRLALNWWTQSFRTAHYYNINKNPILQ